MYGTGYLDEAVYWICMPSVSPGRNTMGSVKVGGSFTVNSMGALPRLAVFVLMVCWVPPFFWNRTLYLAFWTSSFDLAHTEAWLTPKTIRGLMPWMCML